MSDDGTITGRRLTFIQLIKEYNIQIPIIQRDYAQGRVNVNEIRESFLDALYQYLDENKKERDLDFVYGNRLTEIADEQLKFIPLDGQQRLTTLFLLHWYLALHDGEITILREHMLYCDQGKQKKSKFTYETRASSKEFCDSLLASNIDYTYLSCEETDCLSKTIRDSTWYFLSWDSDPTIQSMLIMLDAIHNKFKNTAGYFQRLVNCDNPIITFQFLDLKEFNLTDDLYIKMNARGMPLSPFENFKARFEQYLLKSDFNQTVQYNLMFANKLKQVDLKTYFSYKIDTDWANLFWAHSLTNKKNYDKLIMNFIRAIIVNNYAGANPNYIFLKYLIDKNNEVITFQQYSSNNCLNQKNIKDIIDLLDLLKNGNSKIKAYLSDPFYYNEMTSFDFVCNNNFNQAGYIERIKFHAYCQYLIKWETDKGFEDNVGLKNWMRLVFNLVESTAPYNNEQMFINSIQSLNKLVPYSNNILAYISTVEKIDGFDKSQFFEEKIKATLILQDNAWGELIIPIERQGYFKGQIGFLLFLCGIEKFYKENKNCKWNEQEDTKYKLLFTKYENLARKVFSDTGLQSFPEYLWERAMLAIGEYLIEEGSNQSFLIDSDRDISWKRLLNRDRNYSEHSRIIEELFNKLDDDIEYSLRSIVESYKGEDWRKQFIQNYRLFSYLGNKRYIRKDSNHGFVLFNGERMSGAHAELYSYSFFLKHLEGQKFTPFLSQANYYFAAGDDYNERPCAYIDNWQYKETKYAINILYSYQIHIFEICFFYREQGVFAKEIVDILLSEEFIYQNGVYVIYLPEADIVSKLRMLCRNLEKIAPLVD